MGTYRDILFKSLLLKEPLSQNTIGLNVHLVHMYYYSNSTNFNPKEMNPVLPDDSWDVPATSTLEVRIVKPCSVLGSFLSPSIPSHHLKSLTRDCKDCDLLLLNYP